MNFKNTILYAATLLVIPLCNKADGMMRRARRDAAVLRSHAPQVPMPPAPADFLVAIRGYEASDDAFKEKCLAAVGLLDANEDVLTQLRTNNGFTDQMESYVSHIASMPNHNVEREHAIVKQWFAKLLEVH